VRRPINSRRASLPGTPIGPYEVIAPIGVGGMARFIAQPRAVPLNGDKKPFAIVQTPSTSVMRNCRRIDAGSRTHPMSREGLRCLSVRLCLQLTILLLTNGHIRFRRAG